MGTTWWGTFQTYWSVENSLLETKVDESAQVALVADPVAAPLVRLTLNAASPPHPRL